MAADVADLADVVDDLYDHRSDPFPYTPFMTAPDYPVDEPVLAYGTPAGALQDLADLRTAFRLAALAVERGDRLMALIGPSTRRRAELGAEV